MNDSNRSNMVSSTSFSPSKFPLADHNSMDGTAFLFSNSYHGDEVFDAAFDLLIWMIWEFLLTATKKSSLHSLPNHGTGGESSTKCTHR